MNSIINSGRTSKEELIKLCKTLKIPLNKLYIGWSTDPINKLKKYNILNIGKIAGTHWVCIFHGKDRKIYMDPLGFPSEDKFKNYERSDIQIQGLDKEYCGQFCCLFLYYCMIDEIDRFYSLFNVINE